MSEQRAVDASDELRRLVDAVPSMLAVWDRDLRCRFANRAYERWFGVDPERLIGTTLPELLGPDLYAQNEPHVRAVLQGETQVFERVVPGPDGVRRHSQAHYLPDRVDGVVVGFFAYVTEVTRLKQTEADLHSVIGSLESEIRNRRVAEAHLAETQQSLAVTLASIGAGFIATDAAGRITRLNAVAERLSGWPAAQALGQPLRRVFVREDRPAWLVETNPVHTMLARGLTVDDAQEMVVVSRDGLRTPVELKAALTYGDDASVQGLVMVLRDQSLQMEAAVQSNRLAAIVEFSHDAIIGKTLQGTITSWNAAAEALFGYPASEAIGQSVQMLIPPQRQYEEMQILTRLAQGERVPAFDTLRLAKDGGMREVSVTISPIRDAAGRIVGASKIVREVAQQRRAEAALRESEARLRLSLEAAQIGEWELDPASGEFSRSLRHDRCFGHAELQPVWTVDILLQHVHPDDRADVQAGYRAALAQGRDWLAQCRVVWPDRSVHWISLHGSLLASAGRPQRMLGIVVDITESRNAEESRLTALRLEAENRQVQEATRLKSLFLANMSHELRTPLNAIIGFADLLRSSAVPRDSPKHDIFLGHVANSGRHLLQLINDVLDLSKVEAGKFEFFPEPVDAGALVRQVIDSLHPGLARKSLQISSEIDPTIGELQIDRSRLKQVLYNFLSNAIKFTPPGGQVVVRLLPEGEARFRLEVEDNGIGIKPKQMPLLFTEFQQIDAGLTKQHQGTGLGLALTRRLVEAQGGWVGVRSTPGRGSLFHAVLDRVYRRGVARDQPAAGPPGAPRSARSVLVIESDPAAQGQLAHGLKGVGFEVDAVTTGAQALLQARLKNYDALTLGLQLQDESGLGLLAQIRGGGRNHGAPVRGVSIQGSVGQAAAFAVADVLSKPLQMAELSAAMAPWRRDGLPAARVLVVDDEAQARELMCDVLRRMGLDAEGLASGRQLLDAVALRRPDAIVLDLMMPGMGGFEVLDALQRIPLAAGVPVYIWTAMILTGDEYRYLERSVEAIIGKGGGALASLFESLRRWRAVPGTLRAAESAEAAQSGEGGE